MAALRPVVLVLPARNEERSVGDVVARVPDRAADHPVVCIVVDDGSTDATATKAEGAGARVVRQPPRGLGAAVRTGLAAAVALDAAAVAFCDADGEYAPEELERLVEPILDGDADYVAGSRFAGTIRRMHAHRRLGNRLLTFAVARLARRPITDGQSGYRALSLEAARAAEIVHDYNYAQVLTIDLVRKGFRYAEVPISYSFRREGRSFVRLLPYLRNVVPAVWRELRSPSDAQAIHVGGPARGQDGDLDRGAERGGRSARPEPATAGAHHGAWPHLPHDGRGVRHAVLRSPEP
jgi:glycosyltransferase involved in cell wall biosynthesis